MNATPHAVTPPAPVDDAAAAPASFGAALRFWLKLGFISFGGPAGQIAIMHAEVVERRRWLSEGRFLHALNYCMLLPGPEAQQLATYIGWLMHGRWGGLAAGLLFVLPSLGILVALSWAYMAYGSQPLVAAVFDGVKPAVVAIVLHAAWRIGRRALRHRALWALAAAAFVATFVAGAALTGWLGARRWPQVFMPAGGGHGPSGGPVTGGAWIDDATPTPPHARFTRGRLARVLAIGVGSWLALMAALTLALGWQGTLTQMAWFFSKAALLTIGGAYAVLPYVFQGAVEHHQWLSAPQMIDGLALGETTPGPLIMVVAFVGFVGGWLHDVAASPWLGGVLAATLVTVVTFLPSFVFIFAGAPMVEATRGRLGFTAPLTAVTAAIVGVIVHLALFFGWHVLWPDGAAGGVDVVAAAVAAASLVALLRLNVGVVTLIAVCAVLGRLRGLLLG